MFTVILENQSGETVEMGHNFSFTIINISGLSPPSGTISTSGYAGTDGSYLNNAFIEKRNIVINFRMQGINIERRRHALYRVVRLAGFVRIYYRTPNIDVYTEGIVETCQIDNFASPTSGQISILCPDIYWYSRKPVYAYYGRIVKAFAFPFPKSDERFPLGTYNSANLVSVYNSGDEIGFRIIIETESGDNVPEIVSDSLTIYNAVTNEYLQIRGEIRKGDRIEITTKTGNKTVTLIRNGVSENIINRLASGSAWLAVRPGENRFRVSGGQYLKITFIHTDAFLGV